MSHWAAITVLGEDRPGIVAAVSRSLYAHGCNLEDSSATRLRDAFAMILIARLPEPDRFEELRRELEAIAAELEVGIDLRDLGQREPLPPPEGERFMLSVYGADQPGIVYKVSEALADCGCNIVDVATRVAGPPAAPVYVMLLEMTVPPAVSSAAVSDRLARLRAELPVDISLRPVEQETL